MDRNDTALIPGGPRGGEAIAARVKIKPALRLEPNGY
jgi:hypothetical protein